MEQPGFRVQRHFDELESGMHVWLCEVPAATTMTRLLKRLKADLPAFRHTEISVFSRQPCPVCHRLTRAPLATVGTPSRNFS